MQMCHLLLTRLLILYFLIVKVISPFGKQLFKLVLWTVPYVQALYMTRRSNHRIQRSDFRCTKRHLHFGLSFDGQFVNKIVPENQPAPASVHGHADYDIAIRYFFLKFPNSLTIFPTNRDLYITKITFISVSSSVSEFSVSARVPESQMFLLFSHQKFSFESLPAPSVHNLIRKRSAKTQSRIIRIFLIITEPFQAHRPSS